MKNEITKLILIISFFLILVPSNVLAPSVYLSNTITQCTVIDRYDVYSLTSDLTANGNCIVITANNVVLNCQNHKIIGDKTGIGIDVSAIGVTINNCDISNFKQAIYIKSSGNANIFYNKLYNNDWGIYVVSNNNFIKGNVILDNIRGVVTDYSSGNTIYDNYFNNPTNAGSDTLNKWNEEKITGPNIISGPYLGGNYWNNYAGSDTTGDGLGEIPHPISGGGGNNDNLPLVDINPPTFINVQVSSSPTELPPPNNFRNWVLNVTWKDNVKMDQAIIELDGVNYTGVVKVYENEILTPSLIEDRVIYSKTFNDVPNGIHYYKWYTKDTRNNWASSGLLAFGVQITTTTRLSTISTTTTSTTTTIQDTCKINGGTCLIDAITCSDLGDCQCRVSNIPFVYPNSCTSDKPTCCVLGSAKPNECSIDTDCPSGYFCVHGWQSNCCMPAEKKCIFQIISPSPASANSKVTAKISGLSQSNGKSIYVGAGIGRGKETVFKCSCTVLNDGCSCSFNVPSVAGNYIYYARIDKNGDRDYLDPGEEDTENVTVTCQARGQSCDASRPCCSPNYCDKSRICSPVGRGCPILNVWNGEEFVEVETLNIHSEEGVDTIYSIYSSMEPIDGKYEIILKEASYLWWEGSHMDNVRLTDKQGKECRLISAVHSKHGNVLTAIEKSDNIRTDTMPGEWLTLKFDGCTGKKFNFSVEGYNPQNRFVKMALSYDNLPSVIICSIICIVLMVAVFSVFKRTLKAY